MPLSSSAGGNRRPPTGGGPPRHVALRDQSGASHVTCPPEPGSRDCPWHATLRDLSGQVLGTALGGLGCHPLGGLEQFVPGTELHPGTAELLPGGPLELVDGGPARVQDGPGVPFGQEVFHRSGGRLVTMTQLPLLDVLEQLGDRLGRVLLVGADDPRRAALDPTGAIRPADGLAVVGHDAAALVSNRAAPLVERKLRQADAAVADAPKHEAALDRLALIGGNGDETSIPLLEPVAYELDRLNFLVAVERNRRHEEAKADGHWLARLLARGEVAQNIHVATSVGVVLERGLAHRVELKLGR